MWNAYFPKAHVYGIDITIRDDVARSVAGYNRIHLSSVDAYNPDVVRRLGLADESMDIVVDDAVHHTPQNERVSMCGGSTSGLSDLLLS